MNIGTVAKAKRLRGAILKLLCTNHDEQLSRFDATSLWSALVRGLAFDASRFEVITTLQDLKGRGYVDFRQRKDEDRGTIYLAQIELCPKGRDLLEGTVEDPAVEI